MEDCPKPLADGERRPKHRPTLLEQGDQQEAEEFAKRCEQELSLHDPETDE